jgi:hypothetical protein
MKDLSIGLENRPGALAALARQGVSIEGGGAFVFGGTGSPPLCCPMARLLARRSRRPE